MEQSSTTLPEDLPGKEKFEAAGINDLEDIQFLKGDYKTVKGIGAKLAKQVDAYLKGEKVVDEKPPLENATVKETTATSTRQPKTEEVLRDNRFNPSPSLRNRQ
jgi:hypothetical protein